MLSPTQTLNHHKQHFRNRRAGPFSPFANRSSLLCFFVNKQTNNKLPFANEQTVNGLRKVAWTSVFRLMSLCPYLYVHVSMSLSPCLRVHVFHVFLGGQTMNGNRRLLFQQTCPICDVGTQITGPNAWLQVMKYHQGYKSHVSTPLTVYAFRLQFFLHRESYSYLWDRRPRQQSCDY